MLSFLKHFLSLNYVTPCCFVYCSSLAVNSLEDDIFLKTFYILVFYITYVIFPILKSLRGTTYIACYFFFNLIHSYKNV